MNITFALKLPFFQFTLLNQGDFRLSFLWKKYFLRSELLLKCGHEELDENHSLRRTSAASDESTAAERIRKFLKVLIHDTSANTIDLRNQKLVERCLDEVSSCCPKPEVKSSHPHGKSKLKS